MLQYMIGFVGTHCVGPGYWVALMLWDHTRFLQVSIRIYRLEDGDHINQFIKHPSLIGFALVLWLWCRFYHKLKVKYVVYNL